MPYTGIHNENELYSHHYLAEIFSGDIQATLERWREQAESANARTPWAELRALAPEYLRFRGDFNRERRSGQRILRQRECGSGPCTPNSSPAPASKPKSPACGPAERRRFGWWMPPRLTATKVPAWRRLRHRLRGLELANRADRRL